MRRPPSSPDPLTRDSRPDLLTKHSGRGLKAAGTPTRSPWTAGPTCSEPAAGGANFKEAAIPPTTNIIGVDWEKDGWRVSVDGQPATKIPRAALIDLAVPPAATVVVESAHLQARNAYSVAQVLAADELAAIPFRSQIKLFPGKLSWRAAEFAGNAQRVDGRLVVDKAKDAESIAAYAAAHPASVESWRPYALPGEEPSRRLWPHRDALRLDLKLALNEIRTAWNAMNTADAYALPEVARLCALLDARYDDLGDDVRAQFGIRRTRNGIRVERRAAVLTIYLAVVDRSGRLRRRPDGGFIGCRFITSAIGMSHSHVPNMARSQLTHHGLRHFAGSRGEYMRGMRRLIRLFASSAALAEAAA